MSAAWAAPCAFSTAISFSCAAMCLSSAFASALLEGRKSKAVRSAIILAASRDALRGTAVSCASPVYSMPQCFQRPLGQTIRCQHVHFYIADMLILHWTCGLRGCHGGRGGGDDS